jgi:hypothetical protein
VNRHHFGALVRRSVARTRQRLALERFRAAVTDKAFAIANVSSRDTGETVRLLYHLTGVRATPRQVRGMARYLRLYGVRLRHLV